MGLLVLDDAEERAAEVVPAFDRRQVLGRHEADGAFALEFLVAFDERADGLLQLGVEGLAGAAGVHLGQRAVERGDPCGVFATGRDVRREIAGDERHAERRIPAGGAFEVEQGAVFGVAVGLGALAGLFGGLAEFGAVLQDAVRAHVEAFLGVAADAFEHVGVFHAEGSAGGGRSGRGRRLR
jgi:hypothetical protein